MAAASYLLRNPEPAHSTVRIAFTVDEEIGQGTRHFDLDAFGADAAYTLDGSGLGELEVETFSADQVVITIRGRSFHPGTAKGKLVNAVKLAADLVAALPADRLSPETTEGREGFVHPNLIEATTEEAKIRFIVRDHDDALLAEHEAFLRALADEVVQREPRARVTVDVSETYRNMRPAIEAIHVSSPRRGGDPPRRRRAPSGR